LIFAVDAFGRLVARREVAGRVMRLVSETKLPLRRWVLVSLSYADGRLSFTIDGHNADAVEAPPLVPPSDLPPWSTSPLIVGHVRTPHLPYPKKIHPLLPATYSLEGSLGSLVIHSDPVSPVEMAREIAAVDTQWLKPTPPPKLPRWPRGAGPFGAFYATLHFDPAWDDTRRVEPDSDVVVRFPQSAMQLVFWQGLNYIPAWVTENDRWYSDEFMEVYGPPRCTGGEDCEPMSDKQVRYSHVRILENSPARVVIDWRYALSEVQDRTLADSDDAYGWGDRADEYWTVYPDGVAVRKQTLWSTAKDRDSSEFQESIIVMPAGERPEDNIHYDALTLANLQGQTATYSWPAKTSTGFADPGGPKTLDKPDGAMIQWVNLKSQWKPFQVAGGSPVSITGINWEPSMSAFEWWNHWPVAQLRSSGRPALTDDRPSHSSLSNIKWPVYSRDRMSITKIMMTGLTDSDAAALAPRARSWLHPAPATLTGPGKAVYDPAQRAYVVTGADMARPVRVKLDANPAHPLVDPAIVVEGWRGKAHVSTEGAVATARLGYVDPVTAPRLVVYLPLTAARPVTVTIAPAS
jgi:hypothetical protein